IHEGPSAYSDLTKLPNGNLGCLYEAGEESPYEGVAFSEVDINLFN
ncbi:MAG: glycosyl hydrolase, partial [Flammeovirgaceae bacterium]|nr:glycosyl hydrolase [Flammeovirgaceae bacterium]